MTNPVARAARAAAAILALDHSPSLPVEVEAVLAARDSHQRPDRFIDPVSLGSLIVSIATLAWTIYKDQRAETPDPQPDAIAHGVQDTLSQQGVTLPSGTEKITEIIVHEITRTISSQ